MWIKTTHDATSRLYDADLDVELNFSTKGTAQVSSDVGEQLLEKYSAFEARDQDDEDDDSPAVAADDGGN